MTITARWPKALGHRQWSTLGGLQAPGPWHACQSSLAAFGPGLNACHVTPKSWTIVPSSRDEVGVLHYFQSKIMLINLHS